MLFLALDVGRHIEHWDVGPAHSVRETDQVGLRLIVFLTCTLLAQKVLNFCMPLPMLTLPFNHGNCAGHVLAYCLIVAKWRVVLQVYTSRCYLILISPQC